MKPLFGGIEGGGTKFVCAVGTGPDDIRAEIRFPTTTPSETLGKAVDFFKEHKGLAAIGVASFGPVDLHPSSPTYGHIMSTPKPTWSNANIVDTLRAAIDLPIGFDTDVNAAALSEWRWGAAQNCDPVLYMTIGTGIGGGALVNSKLLHGFIHPEMGHVPLPHDFEKDPFEGICPFHGDCFEGLASGPAIQKRWEKKAEDLPDTHPAWELEAHYIAHALANYIYTLSPQKIVIGGGVTQQPSLLPLVRQKLQALINNYLQSPDIIQNIDDYIVLPGLGNRSGVLGAIALAEQAYNQKS